MLVPDWPYSVVDAVKVLFLLPQIPYPPHSGGRIVTWNTIKRFAKECEVHVACLYHHPDELNDLSKVESVCASAKAFPAKQKWDLPLMARSCFSTWPYKAHRFYNRDMAKYVQEMIREEKIDIVHAQNFYTTTYIRGDEPCLKIHYKENLEGNVLLRYSRASDNPFIKVAAWLEGKRTLWFERSACRKFDQVLSISPIDRELMASYEPGLNIAYQCPGVDLETYPLLEEPEGPPTVVFTGTMSYYPNADGVRVFLCECWADVRSKIPNAECWIVGSGSPDDISDWDGRDGVHVTGRVDDISDYIKRAKVYMVPLRVGGGIRLKILESMASGRAVVSTSVGCEGLSLIDEEHLLIKEIGSQFSSAVVDLLRDDEKRKRLRMSARALMETVYDWDVVINQQLEQYQSLMEHQRMSHSRLTMM